MVCGSKVHALGKLLNTELAEHVLGFAVCDSILPAVHPDAHPDACRKCRAEAIVDMSDRRVRRAWFHCLRERRVRMERHLANLERDGR